MPTRTTPTSRATSTAAPPSQPERPVVRGSRASPPGRPGSSTGRRPAAATLGALMARSALGHDVDVRVDRLLVRDRPAGAPDALGERVRAPLPHRGQGGPDRALVELLHVAVGGPVVG